MVRWNRVNNGIFTMSTWFSYLMFYRVPPHHPTGGWLVMLQRSPPPFSDAWEPQGLPGSNNSNNLVGWVLKTSVDIHASYMFDLLFLLNYTCICLYYLTYVYHILFFIMYNIYIICIHIYIYVRTTIITSNGYYCYHIIT